MSCGALRSICGSQSHALGNLFCSHDCKDTILQLSASAAGRFLSAIYDAIGSAAAPVAVRSARKSTKSATIYNANAAIPAVLDAATAVFLSTSANAPGTTLSASTGAIAALSTAGKGDATATATSAIRQN